MRTKKKQQVEELGQALAALPIRPKVLDEAMEWFVSFGEPNPQTSRRVHSRPRYMSG